MQFIARTPIKYLDGSGKVRTIAPGRPVPEEHADEDLVACGAIEGIDAFVKGLGFEGEGGTDKPLNKQAKAELLATAAAEQVNVPDGATNPQIIELIEAKRSQG